MPGVDREWVNRVIDDYPSYAQELEEEDRQRGPGL